MIHTKFWGTMLTRLGGGLFAAFAAVGFLLTTSSLEAQTLSAMEGDGKVTLTWDGGGNFVVKYRVLSSGNSLKTWKEDPVGSGEVIFPLVNEMPHIFVLFDPGSGKRVDETQATPTASPDYMLTVSPDKIREDAKATNLTVKIKAAKKNDSDDTYVILGLGTQTGLNDRFRITLPTLMIPKGKDEATGTIVFTPISGTGDDRNLNILIVASGSIGTAPASDTLTLIDADQPTNEITLSLSPKEVSQEAGPTTITVEATLNGETVGKDLSFSLIVRPDDEDTTNAGDEATRDTDYTISGLGRLTIPRNSVSSTATFTINPKQDGGGSKVTINAPRDLDLRYNADTTNEDEEQDIKVSSARLTITEKPIADIKDDKISATPASIREEAGRTPIELKVTLANALLDDAAVSFSILGENNAERDVNYTAEFGDPLTIPAGETSGTATLIFTTINDNAPNDPREVVIQATVGNSDGEVTITITDDDSNSKNIKLSADPAEIKEDAGETDVTITATLDGKVLDDDAKLTLVLGNMLPTESKDPKVKGDGATATRDVDYTAIIRSLTIPAGEVSGSRVISITPVDDGIEDADETIKLKSTNKPKNARDEDITVSVATIKLTDTGKKEAPAAPADGTPSFTADDIAASDTVIEGTAGMALEMELPAASGNGELTYSVSANLPAGLSFNQATRTISGTPAAAGTAEIIYTVIDGDTGEDLPAESAALTYTIEIAKMAPPVSVVEKVEASPSSVRENGEAIEMRITATLAAAAPKAEMLSFTLGAASENSAVRDVDYTAAMRGSVSIEEGATSASTTLTLTPLDNDATDGNKYIVVRAQASGGSESATIKIADDETASTSISLSANPNAVNENDGQTVGTITATLDGKVLDADQKVIISVDPNSEAARDEDYQMLFDAELTIPAGEVSGSVNFVIDPRIDADDEGSETITLVGTPTGGAALAGGTVTIKLDDYDAPMDAPPLTFAEGTMIDGIEATAGTAIADVTLPEATGGLGDIAYSVSELPAGLSFDADTRTLSGTPEAEDTMEVTYTAAAGDENVSLTFSIKVNAMLDFGDLGSLFGALTGGAGKANPADEHDEGAIRLFVDVPVSLTLPAVESGGTPPLTYSVSGLPAGLSFDPATRTVSGTPTTESEVSIVTYTVMDASGASQSIPVPVVVVLPPLDAPDNLVAEDYKGADGLGDQGGFVMLSWELSEHHDRLDGYRIFRALPVLGNEMVPWAMVDAVPGVEMGRAIVATLDNVSTRWGIAAESGGRTTHGAAKAVFVSAENLNQPYELMAETLMASREAAQAGDGPVFASLLPEALAYAQGVAPKLNVIDGVLSSALTITEEAVRATDDIPPLAVPSLSVLDAPNDQGSRIVLTWALSPSDRLLQGVIAGAVGPAELDPVVGVHGYSIYRRAAGEDEFVMIAQVDAGVASFVDETALNGVHYTYQVRPYDLDNETGSDVEQTAMAVRNSVVDSEGRTIFGLFGTDSRIGFDDFFIFADNFGLTAADAGFDPAFDLAPNAAIDFDDFFVFADNFGRSTAAAGKRVPMFAGLNADARLYLDARTALPNVGEDFVLDVRLADFTALKGYGLQVQYEADKLAFVEVRTDQPLGGSALATPQVLADQAGVLTVATHGALVADGAVALSLVFRPTVEIESTRIEVTDTQTYDSAFGFNRLARPAPVQVQTRPAVFSLADNYPNPFNPATTIQYALPQAADVALTVYNVLGQPVRTLVAEHQSAGRYVVEWDATNDSGHSLSSGMYFYRLEASGEFLEVKKMLLLK